MAQPNKFQFILNIRGVITEVLANAPDGWLNTAIKYTRSKTYQGLFRGETLPAKYVTRAAYLLRKELYNYGVLSFVQVVINLFNPGNWGYNTIYQGRLDFSTAEDDLASISIGSITDDFTIKLNANDAVDYMIPIDAAEAVNIEISPLSLRESATFVPGAPPDGNIHSDYWPPMQLAAYQQNSVNYSAQQVQYNQQRSPDFAASNNNFFYCRVTGKVKLTGSINFTVRKSGGTTELRLGICNQFGGFSGGTVLMIFDETISGGDPDATLNFTFNHVLNANKDDKWFLYMQQVESETSNTGITINGGTLQLDYNTISPATMCKALPGNYVFGALLQAMNTNTDSGPNQPVPFKSDLLTGDFMSKLMITCSDSIRNAVGSILHAGDTLFSGFYKVIQGSVTYGGHTFVLNDQFSYLPGTLTFTGTGVIQKVISGFVGTVYNPGDDLQAGGTYLVGGTPGTFVTYNAISYNVGETFIYVLGQATFTGSDDTSFVEQVGVAIQLILNFRDFFQSIYGVQGGNCSFGVETIPNPNPLLVATQPTVGQCFIEDLPYVYRGTIGNLDAGKVDTGIKIQPASDIIPNSIKVGFKDQQYSTLNGYAEVNSEQTYITSIVNPKKQLNLVSVIRADPYGIAEICISQQDTSASRSNNENFFVYINPSSQTVGSLTYYKPQLTSNIVGVDPSYYNYDISPKHNLLRGAPYLASLFYKIGGYSLTLSAAPKNTAMVVTDGGVHIAEAAPVQISSLGLPLFLPFYVTFKPGIEQGGLQMIDSVPYGFIRFTYNGTVYKMFADEITVDIGQNSQQTFKGLFTPGNDLRTLIH